MANKYRGDVVVEIDGESVTLSPSFDVLANIESETGMSVLVLAAEASRVDLRLATIVTIISAACNACGHKVAEDSVKRYVEQVGPLQAVMVISDLFTNAFMVDDENPPKAGSGSAKKKSTRSTAS